MPRTIATAELNTFIGGLVTDVSPLTFPENGSLDEENFVLNRDGSRNRRLGVDFESNHVNVDTTVSTSANISQSSYQWENAGGDPDKVIIVVQLGNEVTFFDSDASPISGGRISSASFSAADISTIFSYAVVDGILVVASGSKDVTLFTFDSENNTITSSTTNLLIRDLFGVEDVVDGVNLTAGSGVEIRPTVTTQNHLYNLRNQSWAIPRIDGREEFIQDTLRSFREESENRLPSNSDTVNQTFYADPNDPDDRTVERFFASDLVKNPIGGSPAARGYFIIDALERGQSRLSEINKLHNRYSLEDRVTSLRVDRTPGGPTVVSEFAGRVWYGGFSGEVVDGDEKSPRMSSYILFSQLVNDASEIGLCYQSGDPTSRTNPDIVDTDGGFIRLDGAYGIKALVNVGISLIVLATNGVWRVEGGNDFGFSASQYRVEKISEHGVRGAGSVVVIDNTVMFWGDDGIYHVRTSQFGDWEAFNITQNRIQTFYDGLSTESKNLAQGLYDTFERKVRWIYENRIGGTNETQELVLDVNINAFYKNRIKNLDDTGLPKVISPFQTKPFSTSVIREDVAVGGELVCVGTDVVQVETTVNIQSTREIGYVVVTRVLPTIQFSFGFFRDTNFREWRSVDGTGVDANAFLLTGYLSANDFQRQKQVGYLTAHLRRTEDGFSNIGGVITPTNQSSCILQGQFDWNNSAAGGKWGSERQIYRYRRHFIPEDVDDDYDTGDRTIVTKNKVRGRGRVVSFLFKTEPDRNLHLYGWSLTLATNQNV